MAGSGTYVYSRAAVDLSVGDAVVSGDLMSQDASSVVFDRKTIVCPTIDTVKANLFQFGYAECDELGKFKISGNSRGMIASKFYVYLYDSIGGEINYNREYMFTLTRNPFSVCQVGEGTLIGKAAFRVSAGHYFWLKVPDASYLSDPAVPGLTGDDPVTITPAVIDYNQVYDLPEFSVGEQSIDKYGNVFVYSKAIGNIEPGQVQGHWSSIGQVAGTVIDSKTVSVLALGVYDANLFANGVIGSKELGVQRIKSHGAFTLIDAENVTLIDSLPSSAVVGHTYQFALHTSVHFSCEQQSGLNASIGVSRTNVNSGQYFWLQATGLVLNGMEFEYINRFI